MKSTITINQGFRPANLVFNLETSSDAAALYAIFNNSNITNTLDIDGFSDTLRAQLKETGMDMNLAAKYAEILNAQIGSKKENHSD